MEFGERTQDCSPGHTAKEGPHLVRTGGKGEDGMNRKRNMETYIAIPKIERKWESAV